MFEVSLTRCSNWYKTLSNCYVPEAQIEFVGKSALYD